LRAAKDDTRFVVKLERRRQKRDANAELTTILANAMQVAEIEQAIKAYEGGETSYSEWDNTNLAIL